MPIYEFECQKCYQVTELRLKISDPQPGECPTCSGPLEKLISPSSFVLKGGGWYVTDFRNKAKEKTSEAKKPEKDENSNSNKTEAKPEAGPNPAEKKPTDQPPLPSASAKEI